MRIGEIIQSYLNENKISQRQFAKSCGLSNGYISMLINNTNPKTGKPLVPSLSALMSLSQGLGISLDELLYTADDIEINIAKIKKIGKIIEPSASQTNNAATLTELQREMLDLFDRLSEDEQIKLIGRLEYMVESAEQNAAPKKHGAIYQHAAIAAKGGTLNKPAKKKVKTTLK